MSIQYTQQRLICQIFMQILKKICQGPFQDPLCQLSIYNKGLYFQIFSQSAVM